MIRLAWVLMGLLAAVAVYGFAHEHLFAESLWYPQGRAGLLLYAAVFWPVAGLLVWLAPRHLGAVAAVAAVAYAGWWSGPAAPLAVLYFAGSCWLLGRMLARGSDGITQTLLGAAVWMSVAWMALHFPVNTRAVYAAALAAPYAVSFRRHSEYRFRERWPAHTRGEAAAFALLLFVLGAHFLVALKPEISSDGLSMHLALPLAVLREGRWAFDFRQYAWAVMPLGGDTLYTVACVLGGAKSGEAAARLLNFGFLATIAMLVAGAVRRYLTPKHAGGPLVWLAAALFASTPLVQLVTGSLFIENVWAAFVLAAALSLGRYLEGSESRELQIAAFLTGAAAAVKLIAGAFAVPMVVLAVVSVVRRRQWRSAVLAAAWMVLAGAAPYVYAYAKTGNPVFPFENQIFRAPAFNSTESFDDPRFHGLRTWKTPYELTFRSTKFFEGQGGAAGFQYFLLLGPAALLLLKKRREWKAPVVVAAVAMGAAAIILAVLPNLRYLYPVLPLFSIVIAGLGAETPWLTGGVFTALIALNFCFLPASGWYDNEFALYRHSAIAPYLERMAPVRPLIAYLNRTAPGEPVAFFSTDATAGLDAPAYTDTWHSDLYWNRVRFSSRPEQVAAVFQELGLRHVIAPVSFQAGSAPIHEFMRRWLDPGGPSGGPLTIGRLGVFRVRATPLAVPSDIQPYGPGSYDDILEGVAHVGGWIFDRQFAEAAHGTLTYSDERGDLLRFQFAGRGIAYIYTKTFNRGIAQVLIDGTERARLNQYAPRTEWQVSSAIRGLAPGTHTFELRVTGEKDARSSGVYVDFDGFEVTE